MHSVTETLFELLNEIYSYSRFKIIISSEKLKHGRTLTTSQYTITHILYFKTLRTVIENTKVT